MREVAVVGVGMTRFGVSQNTNIEMFSEAAMEAINESNLKPKDIEALFLGNVLGSHEEGIRGCLRYRLGGDQGCLHVGSFGAL
ncbi:hypothetical protein M1N46_01255 [Dehalococcoidia bacterium]|nr:hypothetical protein [Dehalococcoidia bacterium]